MAAGAVVRRSGGRPRPDEDGRQPHPAGQPRAGLGEIGGGRVEGRLRAAVRPEVPDGRDAHPTRRVEIDGVRGGRSGPHAVRAPRSSRESRGAGRTLSSRRRGRAVPTAVGTARPAFSPGRTGRGADLVALRGPAPRHPPSGACRRRCSYPGAVTTSSWCATPRRTAGVSGRCTAGRRAGRRRIDATAARAAGTSSTSGPRPPSRRRRRRTGRDEGGGEPLPLRPRGERERADPGDQPSQRFTPCPGHRATAPRSRRPSGGGDLGPLASTALVRGVPVVWWPRRGGAAALCWVGWGRLPGGWWSLWSPAAGGAGQLWAGAGWSGRRVGRP